MGELISESQRSLVFKESAGGTNAEIIWKVSSSSRNSISELANEYNITRDLTINGIRKPLSKGIYQNKVAFSYHYFPGRSVGQYLHDRSLSLKDVLRIAVKVTGILTELHSAGVFHHRINSNNILYNERTGAVQIIDFSLATQQREIRAVDFESWGSELAYISPEQTGRLKQVVDNRTDLYSFGVVLYEMITGRLPFTNENSAELVLSHLSQVPVPASEVKQNIPKVISSIIDKLLSKQTETRYQSAFGVKHDLQQCLHQLDDSVLLDSMQLGLYDRSYQLNLSKKNFGRKTELQTLKAMVDSVAKGGNEVVFLSGDTGLGKSLLVEEIKNYVQQRDGILITEKYEAAKQNIPYHGVIGALKEITSIVLSESDFKLAEWKSVLSRAAEDDPGYLIRLVPELKWILEENGSVGEPSDTFPKKLTSLSIFYQKILQGITTQKRFAVVFMEDIQWADLSSLKNIESLIANTQMEHLLIICCFRSAGSEDVAARISRWKALRESSAEIQLKNLNEEDVIDFIRESFPTDDIVNLGKITYTKTLGHPFFLHQFIRSLYRDNVLRYSPESGMWMWDKERIADVAITDNVVEYTSDRVSQLPESTRKLLMTASCIGNEFLFPMLQNVAEMPEESVRDILDSLLEKNILQHKETGEYSFSHERVHEATYSSLQEEERSRIHYRIANVLSSDKAPPREDSTFAIANHYNSSGSFLKRQERYEVARLNYIAGMQAKRAAAFEVAYRYFVAAISLIEESDWDLRYDEVLLLYNEATETGMLAGAHDEALLWLKKSVEKARTVNDSVKAHEIRLNHLSENHNFSEAVSYLLEVLKQIGFEIPRHPGKAKILKEYVKVKWLLRNKRIEDIPMLPPIENEQARAFIKLTVNSLASIFGNAPDILPIVIFTQVRLSLTYGNSVYSPIAYSSYGFAITVFIGDLGKGYRFGKMALQLVDQLDAEIVKAKVLVQFYAFLSYWKDPFRQSIEPLREAYIVGRRNGDFLYAAFGLSFHSAIRLHSGDNLQELLETMTADCHLIRGMKQELVYIISESQRQFAINLTEPVSIPWILHDEDFNEAEMLKQLDTLGDSASKFDVYYYKLVLACIFNDYDRGLEFSESAAIFEDETTSRQITYPTFLMYSTMAALKQLSSIKSPIKKQRFKRKISARIKSLENISRHAPQNFRNKHSFVCALLYEQQGNLSKAAEYFQASIIQSQESNFIHEEAVVREHFAYFNLRLENKEFADLMLQKSYDCYESWGALSKCRQLKERFPAVIGRTNLRNKDGISGYQNIYDLNMIINANQALSSENTLDGLLKRFMEIVIKNASASNAVIVVKSTNGILQPKATANSEAIETIAAENATDKKLFPSTVVNFVARSLSVYVSKNLSEEKIFSFDPYIQERKPLSACCIPIVVNDRFLGAIYLENNLGEAAFDDKRIGIFKTISSQLAISLDNVFLYEQMEQKVDERTMELVQKNSELSAEKKKSDDLLLNILPFETAEELKANGKTVARLYKDATVLFSDIRDFSKYAEILAPEQLVLEIDLYFRAFDEIATKFGLEKIKTIGDAYMAVGGVPHNNRATVQDVVQAAISMQKFTTELARRRQQEGKHFFEIRVGIHTGPVIAGVVGSKKFQYDLWGETVNIAARMEQNSQPGKINITEQTYRLVRDEFTCTPRGKIRAKSLGETDMYFVEWQS